jgi:hypothetical protein
MIKVFMAAVIAGFSSPVFSSPQPDHESKLNTNVERALAPLAENESLVLRINSQTKEMSYLKTDKMANDQDAKAIVKHGKFIPLSNVDVQQLAQFGLKGEQSDLSKAYVYYYYYPSYPYYSYPYYYTYRYPYYYPYYYYNYWPYSYYYYRRHHRR